MPITALAYLGIRSDLTEDWTQFASGLLGMQKVDAAGKSMAFRMDDRRQRLVVSDEPGETLAFLGFEVAEKSDLQAFAARLDAARTQVHPGDSALKDRRLVEDMIWFLDPMGNRVELVFAPGMPPASGPVRLLVHGRPLVY